MRADSAVLCVPCCMSISVLVNGTRVNHLTNRIPSHTPYPLYPGDCIILVVIQDTIALAYTFHDLEQDEARQMVRQAGRSEARTKARSRYMHSDMLMAMNGVDVYHRFMSCVYTASVAISVHLHHVCVSAGDTLVSCHLSCCFGAPVRVWCDGCSAMHVLDVSCTRHTCMM